jgi:hypothetical protein
MYRKEMRMNRARYYPLKVGAIVVMVTLAGFYLAGVSYAQHSHHTMAPTPTQTTPAQTAPSSRAAPPKADPSWPAAQPKPDPALQAIYSKQLPAVQEAVAQAIQHLEAGQQQEALTEMKQVKASLETLRQALGRHVGPVFLNDRCPIMGTKIDSDKVPPSLIRTYGQGKVAFCCDGCPAQWARLTAAEKAAKLKEVAVAPPITQQP